MNNTKAIEAAARIIDPLAFEEQGSCPPRGYECHTPEQLNRVIAARRRHALSVAKRMIAAYQAASGEARDKERLDALQEAFIKGDEFVIRFCVDPGDVDCDFTEHPHFEAFDWTMRAGPVFAKTLRDVIDAAIAAREGVNDE